MVNDLDLTPKRHGVGEIQTLGINGENYDCSISMKKSFASNFVT